MCLLFCSRDNHALPAWLVPFTRIQNLVRYYNFLVLIYYYVCNFEDSLNLQCMFNNAQVWRNDSPESCFANCWNLAHDSFFSFSRDFRRSFSLATFLLTVNCIAIIWRSVSNPICEKYNTKTSNQPILSTHTFLKVCNMVYTCMYTYSRTVTDLKLSHKLSLNHSNSRNSALN